MRAMDSRRDFTSKKVFSGYFSELGEKANSALLTQGGISIRRSGGPTAGVVYILRQTFLTYFVVLHYSLLITITYFNHITDY